MAEGKCETTRGAVAMKQCINGIQLETCRTCARHCVRPENEQKKTEAQRNMDVEETWANSIAT